MASIGYGQTTAFGSKVYLAMQYLRYAQEQLARTKQVMDDLTGGGVTPSNLEVGGSGATMFQVATGQGANFYNAVVSINSAIGTLQAITDLDQG